MLVEERTFRGPHFTDKELEARKEAMVYPNYMTFQMTLLPWPQGRYPNFGVKYRSRHLVTAAHQG
jgi:hypothetical protein